MFKTFSMSVKDEFFMLEFGRRLSQILSQFSENIVIYLNGELGAGKTTLSRGIIQAMGHQGKVKSPTYTLVEEYLLADKIVYHFDLYRLSDPEELEFMGIRDYFRANTLGLLEWAEKGLGAIPTADLVIDIAYDGTGRKLSLFAHSELGQQIICQLDVDHAK
ncbi:tRNA (adenosine(37)-N6)-threonylcarbamoyltransferase complex ATPase subunit type 1 TsaE [Mergibacter septicus]|uniref:tRNA (adenosine(37)-N6)-threonylcarbamoyltransferase complex ATPase subunit type 1 TsaE n=1 Tax=Mergibacter septicus TaxID=221402 RepID=UPI0011793925|nr:tRNA (adenosine(37)-N6)-threonylcarbamoyltransferase complex ATPase subunit type 1 TsaE [Mergibacter septicus]AWX13488.1 tRNA (adenosine(37)-N6)-threonylcarbamoyltransferase complex ATPase subunit type 1 TsaE [Mergibacter septicus]